MAFLSPTTVVDGNSLNIGKLFNVEYLIPNNQRELAWGEKQIKQLWSDFIEHYKIVAPSDDLTNPQGYFLGAIVAVQENASSEWAVVDGQQRLTTLTTVAVVLCEILKKYASHLPQSKALILGLQNCSVAYQGGGLKPWLVYSDVETNTAFNKFCIENLSRKEQKNEWENLAKKYQKKTSPYNVLHTAFKVGYAELIGFLRESNFANRPKRVIAFAQMVLDCVVILRIKAGSYDGAYAIFESLNDRGLRLSQADLVKNELLKVSSVSEKDEVSEHWTNAKQLLSDTPIIMSELLHYSCLHRYGQSKAQKLFSYVKGLIHKNQNAKSIAAGLEEDALALEQIVVLRPQSWSVATSEMLDDITKVISVKFAYPMLLAIHKRFASSKNDFEKAVKLVMNFLYRYMTVGGGTPERLSFSAAEVGKICRNTNLTNKEVLETIKNYFLSESPDVIFEKEFAEFSIANTKLAYFTVYYLEAFCLSGTMPLKHGAESNLEHIMPKTPSQKDWPLATVAKQSDPAAYTELIWSIGNLIPLPEDINKSIKNKSISHKMTGGTKNYSISNLVSPKSLSKYLSTNLEWDEAAIHKRQQDLSKMAPKVWPLSI
jgi:hypothetical protein